MASWLTMDDTGTDTDIAAAADAYLRRLERLVRILIGGRFKGGPDIWQFQLDLFELQREVQEAIGAAKKRVRSDTAAWADLESLRNVRWHARRLGDAIAWLLLRLDQRLIYPLAQNEPVSVAREDHGSRGVIGAAIALSNNGWGFPLLHDITDCLRIGDITFVKPDGQIRTVEIKTRLRDERPAPDGKTTFEYEVTALLAPDERPPTLTLATEQSDRSLPASHRPPSPESHPRVERQVQRLRVARAHQESQPNTLGDVDGKPFFVTTVTLTKSEHWKSFRRVVRRARAGGYASEIVENTFLYAAFYCPEGIGLDSVQDPQIAQDLLDSGILFQENRERNALVIHSVPLPEGRGAQLFLPYYLYSLPQTAIMDILHGRLIIFILVNSGRIVAALEEAGYEVTIPSGRNDLSSDSLIISTELEDQTGSRYRVQLQNIQRHVLEMIYEFHSVQHLVEVAAAMRRTAKLAFEHYSDTMFSPRRGTT